MGRGPAEGRFLGTCGGSVFNAYMRARANADALLYAAVALLLPSAILNKVRY